MHDRALPANADGSESFDSRSSYEPEPLRNRARFPRIPRPLRQPVTVVCFALVLAFAAAAAFAPQIAPHDPLRQNLRARLLPPAWVAGGSTDHILGTDQYGRDILSRLILATRVSLTIGLISVTLAGVVGVVLGVSAGYFGGWLGAATMRIADAQFTFPFLILAIAVIAAVGASTVTLIVVLVINQWAVFARVTRAETLSIKARDFVLAGRALGARDLHLLFRYILPSVLPTAVVIWSHLVAHAIIVEGSLSFLGLGVQAPRPSWGNMLAEGRGYLDSAWWIATFSGICLTLLIVSINVTSDALRDVLDPQVRK